MRVVSLGDLALDVVVRVATDIAHAADTPARIMLSAGGQGANVAAWVGGVGRGGPLAREARRRPVGQARRRAAGGLGVELAGPVEPDGTGVVVSLVEGRGERSMFPDRGVAIRLAPAELRPEWLACDHLHVSGYALLAEPVAHAAVAGGRSSRVRPARGSASTSRRGARSATAGPTGFARSSSRSLPTRCSRTRTRTRVFGGRLPGAAWILKHGARGCSFDGDERAALPVPEVVDTTGAGDALAAGWIVGGPDLALEAAARCVQRMGSMP